MKTNNLIIKLISLLFIFVSSGWALSYGFTPSTVYVGEQYKIYANLDASISGYDVRISSSSSSSASAIKLNGSGKNWYKYVTPTHATTLTLYFKLYKDNSFAADIGSKVLTINDIPTPSRPSTDWRRAISHRLRESNPRASRLWSR